MRRRGESLSVICLFLIYYLFAQGEVLVVETPQVLLAMPVEERQALVRDKIVLFNEPYRGYGATVGVRYSGPKVVKEAGGLACLIRSVAPWGIKSPHTGGTERGVNFPSAAISIADAMRLQRMFDRGDQPIVKLVMDGTSADPLSSAGSRKKKINWTICRHLNEY